jgi:hypothetical protein
MLPRNSNKSSQQPLWVDLATLLHPRTYPPPSKQQAKVVVCAVV